MNKYIDKMNPFLKLIVLVFVTLIVSFDYMPFISINLILVILLLISLFSSLKIIDVLKGVKAFIFMAISFIVVILLIRYITEQSLLIISTIALGFKIITISIYSSIFIKTTDPNELVLCLIKYLRMSPRIGYSFLTAYRFLPTFKDELEIIKYAHEVRGIKDRKNFFSKIWDMKKYVIPMMATAVRKGIRISIAMETRGFGKFESRTFYRNVEINKKELISTSIYLIYILFILFILYTNNLTKFGLVYGG